MSFHKHPSHTPASTDCPTCRSHAAVFRAHLVGSRLYCARCRKTFNAVHQESHSTAFSLGPATGGGSLADTIAFVPDTKAEFDIRVEPMNEPFPAVRLASLTPRRRARFGSLWLGLTSSLRFLALFPGGR